jgi:type 2A phosphatase activator TIP41
LVPLLKVLLQLLPMKDDLTPLTDPMWIAKVLSDLPTEISQIEAARTGWRGLGTKTEVVTLVK